MTRAQRGCAGLFGALLVVTAVLCGLGEVRSRARFDGDVAWQTPHADALAAWAVRSAGARSSSGAGDLFDRE